MIALWQKLADASGFGDGFAWFLLLFFAAVVGLWFALPVHRQRLKATLVLFVLYLLGLILLTQFFPASAASQANAETQATDKWLSILSFYSLSAAVVTLADLILSDIALAAIHLRPPAILSDLILAIA